MRAAAVLGVCAAAPNTAESTLPPHERQNHAGQTTAEDLHDSGAVRLYTQQSPSLTTHFTSEMPRTGLLGQQTACAGCLAAIGGAIPARARA